MTPDNHIKEEETTAIHPNLQLAEWASNKANDLVPYSTNKGNVSDAQHLLQAITRRGVPRFLRKQLIKQNISPHPSAVNQNTTIRYYNENGQSTSTTIATLAKQYAWKESRENRKNGEVLTGLELHENIAKKSVRVGVGNCNELSAIAFMLLLENSDEQAKGTPVERIVTPFHCFTVIGRKKDSSILEPETWGDDAHISGPWEKNNCSVIEEIKKFNKLFGYNSFKDTVNKGSDVLECCSEPLRSLVELQMMRNYYSSYDPAVEMEDYLKGVVGGNHSARWQCKNRDNFIDKQKFFTPPSTDIESQSTNCEAVVEKVGSSQPRNSIAIART